MMFNKATKHFFFDSFKRAEAYIEVEKDLGEEMTQVAIIISPKESILRGMGEQYDLDTDFTVEDMKPFLKMIRVKTEEIKEYKHIFVLLDFKQERIMFQSEHNNGAKKEFEI